MFEKLVNIICNYVEVEPEDVHPESRFMEDLGFTSFDFMSMLGEIRRGSAAGRGCQYPHRAGSRIISGKTGFRKLRFRGKEGQVIEYALQYNP